MSKIILIGKIIRNLPNSTFLVKFKEIKETVCYISGKMKINYIRIMPGDMVKVEFDFSSCNKGRIIYRIK